MGTITSHTGYHELDFIEIYTRIYNKSIPSSLSEEAQERLEALEGGQG